MDRNILRFPATLMILAPQITLATFYTSITLQAKSLLIFLDKSVRGKNTLLAAVTFFIEHALKIQLSQFGVSHALPVTTKSKQTVGIFSNNSGKHTTTKESFHWKLKMVHTFKLPFHFFY